MWVGDCSTHLKQWHHIWKEKGYQRDKWNFSIWQTSHQLHMLQLNQLQININSMCVGGLFSDLKNIYSAAKVYDIDPFDLIGKLGIRK